MSRNELAARSEPRTGWWTSVAFWLCLMITAGLYAGVVLSPKLLVHLSLRDEADRNQWELVQLERQVQRLDRTIEALQHDPAFAREQARVDFGAAAPGEQRIPVGSDLALEVLTQTPSLPSRAGQRPWYAPVLTVFAEGPSFSNSVLGACAVVIVLAFGFLPTSGGSEGEEAAEREQGVE